MSERCRPWAHSGPGPETRTFPFHCWPALHAPSLSTLCQKGRLLGPQPGLSTPVSLLADSSAAFRHYQFYDINVPEMGPGRLSALSRFTVGQGFVRAQFSLSVNNVGERPIYRGDTVNTVLTGSLLGVEGCQKGEPLLRWKARFVKTGQKTLGWPSLFDTFNFLDGFEKRWLFPFRNVGQAITADLSLF